MQTQIPTLREVGLYFFRLGWTGFGGSLAVVAQMEKDLAGRWLPASEFGEVFGAIKTLPGPLAFQMATYLGYRRLFDKFEHRGLAALGGLVAAVGYIFPSMIFILILARTRGDWTNLHVVRIFLIGVQAAALGLIASSVVPLSTAGRAPGEFQNAAKWLFAFFGFVVSLFRPEFEPFAILFCGVLALAPHRSRLLTPIVLPAAALIGVSLWSLHSDLFLICLRAGALIFGSGLAIVPLLGGEFVDRLQWITHTEFLEALSLSQLTPGPVLITATYIGTKVGGIWGGLTATFGMFLIPFIHMTTWFPRAFHRLRPSQQWRRFSFGAVSAVIGAVVAGVIKLMEPVVLSALEIESLRLDRTFVTFVVWTTLPILAFYFVYKKKRPAWAVLLSGGVISSAVLYWF
ncbi:chromate transporter [soil metagenome]